MRNEADLSEGLNNEAEEKSENGDSSIGVESQCHGESVAVEFAREEEEEKEERKKKQRREN